MKSIWRDIFSTIDLYLYSSQIVKTAMKQIRSIHSISTLDFTNDTYIS